VRVAHAVGGTIAVDHRERADDGTFRREGWPPAVPLAWTLANGEGPGREVDVIDTNAVPPTTQDLFGHPRVPAPAGRYHVPHPNVTVEANWKDRQVQRSIEDHEADVVAANRVAARRKDQSAACHRFR